MARTRFTILGCGSSGGVPRPGSGWGACDPANPKNRRRRCSLLIERFGRHGVTRALIDTSPDLREQLIDAGVDHLDAVIYSHDHADHMHGIDDLRPIVLHMRRMIRAYADERTRRTLRTRFGYIFEMVPDSGYPPLLTLHGIEAGRSLVIDGPGGELVIEPFAMEHGANYEALGFRLGGVAYASDVSRLPEAALTRLEALDVLILDALRERPHPTHFSLAEALATIATLKPGRAILTNMHTDLDFARLSSTLPAGIEPAFDGLAIEIAH